MAVINGIVLYTRQYKDHDLLVRMLTEKDGLRTFLARGAKKPKSALSAAVQPCTILSFEGVLPKRNTGLGYINDAQQANLYPRLIDDIEANAYAALIASLIDQSFEEGEPLTRWYHQFELALQKLEAGLDPQVIANIFEIQLLVPLGVAPNWRADPISGQVTGRFDYSEKYNGILAEEHYDLDEHRLMLDQKTIFYLRQFSVIDLRQINQINLSPVTKRGLQRVIDHIYDKQVGLKPRAKTFIEQMHAWQNTLVNFRKNKEGAS
ncbi:DNA repair protein RecO [Leuconostoc lactis]|uniref:DNA repair protein RecO n=2 Tax=Leuconostoc TaxID=1243 RepID=A0AAP9EDB3_LEULA|nr:DNA repair protein RecO [Leuconostoc lactis]MCC2744095.1 DNA repair protein RecO [Leuconostoc lactis]MCC2754578.1 DNA repair protein RecO [Leuconostoc lactis]QEA44743.1 DNA repair protein RecO [Leuconostoc lactis]